MKQIAWLFTNLLAGSCSYFKQESLQKPVARVNNSYLYEEDLKALQEQIASKEDSAQLVSNFINRWATQQLLINQKHQPSTSPVVRIWEIGGAVQNRFIYGSLQE